MPEYKNHPHDNNSFWNRNNSVPNSFFQSALFQEQTSSNAKDNLGEMERLYLQFSFNTLPSAMRGPDEPVKTTSADGQFAAVPGLRNKLEQSLLCVADNLLNCYSPDVSGR